MRAPRAQAALAIGSFVGISLQRIDSEAGAHRRKRPRSLEIYGPLVNETVRRLQKRSNSKESWRANEHSLYTAFFHTLRIKRWARALI